MLIVVVSGWENHTKTVGRHCMSTLRQQRKKSFVLNWAMNYDGFVLSSFLIFIKLLIIINCLIPVLTGKNMPNLHWRIVKM